MGNAWGLGGRQPIKKNEIKAAFHTATATRTAREIISIATSQRASHGMLRAAVLVALSAATHGRVVELTPDNWASTVQGRQWLVYFAVQGCKHCESLAPMMAAVADRTPELRVGRIDATEHNGVARTFNVRRYPTIMLLDSDGLSYEFHGRRTIQRLVSFARGDPILRGGGVVMPSQLQANVSEWWLLAEAVWPPLKTALMWSLGIAFGIKGLSKCALHFLKKNSKKRREDNE